MTLVAMSVMEGVLIIELNLPLPLYLQIAMSLILMLVCFISDHLFSLLGMMAVGVA